MAVERFGRYKVTGKLGAGAMGEVYAAVDEVLGRQVAIKTLHDQTSGLGARLVDERFRLEARAIAALTHPNIVQVFDIDLAADPPFLVMERVTGPSLKERLEQHGNAPMPADDVRALGVQVARALAAAHAAGIVHRDVKPANILVAGPATWKLVDFGVAHVPDSALTFTGQFIGSPAYAAPEALVGGKSTPACDVFGLGATLYLAAAGRWPRADATNLAPLAPIPAVREVAPDVPAALAAAIDRAVALDHAERPTAAELAAALDAATVRPVADTTVFVPDEPPPSSNRRRSWRPFAFAGAGVLLLGAAVAIGTLRSRSSSSSTAAVSDGATTAVAPDAPSPPPAVDDATDLDALADGDAGDDAGMPIEDPPPGQLRIITPPMPTDPKAAKEWRKLADKLYEKKYDEARALLDAWELAWGASPATASLHRQIDAMPR
jgi:eukaryotic-like serine/threonine-protein kinase